MAQKFIDQTTIQPDGRPGDDAFTAFATCNDNFADAEQRLTTLEGGSSNIGQDVAALKSGLQQEAQLRADADTAEANARQNADAALGARIAGKNLLINGDFRIWQRGTNFTANGYTADRWTFNFGGVASGNVWRNTVAIGQFPGVYADALARVSNGNITDSAGHFVVLEQYIEGCDTAAGKTITVSLWVYNSGAAGRQFAIELQQGFGQGGSPTVSGIGAKKFALAAGMNYVTHTVAMPSVAGKNRGPNDSVVLTFWITGGSQWNARNDSLGPQGGDLHFTEVQVEVGGSATGFERRHFALELLLCQRYYEKTYNLSVAPGGIDNQGRFAMSIAVAQGNYMVATPHFTVRKRTTPAIAVYAANSAPIAGNIAQDDGSTRPVSVQNVGSAGFEAVWSNTAGHYGGWFHWTADAEI